LEISKRGEKTQPKAVFIGGSFLPAQTENILAGDRIDLGIFPTPKWHEHDGGRYIGTGDMVITKDPDSGWINVGTYRACVVDKNRLTLWIIDHKHGKQIAENIGKRRLPVAIVLAASPRLGRRRLGGQPG
jgi:UbiD family decarboxylase